MSSATCIGVKDHFIFFVFTVTWTKLNDDKNSEVIVNFCKYLSEIIAEMIDDCSCTFREMNPRR